MRLSATRPALLLLAILAPAFGAAAAPAVANKNAKANVDVRLPVVIENPGDLDFATLSVTTAGTATINPVTGAMTTTGGVSYLAGTPNPAWYRVTVNRPALVLIRLPSAPSVLTRVGGTETMTVSNWTLDGFTLRLVLGNAPLDFYVGGRLNVGAAQADGLYTGTFVVSADYF